MDDLELDRELHAAFEVEPSPEFVARVRTTIGETPSPSMTARLLKPAAAIALAVLVAIALGLPREDARLAEMPATAGLKPSTTNVPTSTNAPAPAARSVVAPTFPPPRLRRFGGPAVALAKAGRSAHNVNEPPLPEVIIAADDVEAFRQFVSSARDLRFVASFDETPASTPWVMTELSIAPIAVDAVESAPAHNN